jgi:hypothetical protein
MKFIGFISIYVFTFLKTIYWESTGGQPPPGCQNIVRALPIAAIRVVAYVAPLKIL